MRRPNQPDKQYLSLELKRFYSAFSTITTPDKQVLSVELIEAAKKRLLEDTDFSHNGTWQVQGELPHA